LALSVTTAGACGLSQGLHAQLPCESGRIISLEKVLWLPRSQRKAVSGCPSVAQYWAAAGYVRQGSCSNALENLCASYSCHVAIRRDARCDPSCCDGRRADEAPGPDCCHATVCRPRSGSLEYDSGAFNASRQTIGNCRTLPRGTTDENSAEIPSSRVGVQNLQDRTLLTLPNRGRQALRPRRCG
jgi:hypothetical protein